MPTSDEPIIVGVDPGSRNVGIVVRAGPRLLHAELVTNDADTLTDQYVREVLDALNAALDTPAALSLPVVACEDLNEPTPFLGLTNVRGLIDTAQIVGAIRAHSLARGFRLVMVPPGGHGSAPLQSYPSELVGDREKSGTGKRRHVRSAFDVASTAAMMLRVSTALAEPF